MSYNSICFSTMSIYIGNKCDITEAYTSSDTRKIQGTQLTSNQIRLIKSSWEMINDDFMKCSQLLFSRLMKEAPDSIDLFTFAKGSGMYNPNYEMDMKRHSLKVVNAICWAVSKCDRFDDIKADLIKLGERHRNYGLKLCYIKPMESVIMELIREYLGHLDTPEIQEAWTVFLRVLMYSIFHPLLRQHKSSRREQVFFRDFNGKIVAVTEKKVFLFWIVVIALLMGWLRITTERIRRGY